MDDLCLGSRTSHFGVQEGFVTQFDFVNSGNYCETECHSHRFENKKVGVVAGSSESERFYNFLLDR